MTISYRNIVPHTGVHIDTTWRRLLGAVCATINPSDLPAHYKSDLQRLWTSAQNQNAFLPCLSVRSGLDLFLTAKSYPPGSEVIMSAVNIPDMVSVLHAHELVVVPLDVSIATLAPKAEMISELVTSKTVAVLVAHLYGRWFQMDAVIRESVKHELSVIEDCAESFCGFEKLGDSRADVSLFSFGVIKHHTAFGGAIAKVRDADVVRKMSERQSQLPWQSRADYLRRLMKYSIVHLCLDCPVFMKPSLFVLRMLGIQLRDLMVDLLRGFPDQLITRLRHQPSVPLMRTLARHLMAAQELNSGHLAETRSKAEYIACHLPPSVRLIGHEAYCRNHWLYPILVESPQAVSRELYRLGVESYHRATQLALIQPDDPTRHTPNDQHYPHEAKFMLDHILYLPVNRNVRYRDLDRICLAVHQAVAPSGCKDDWCEPYAASLVKPRIISKL